MAISILQTANRQSLASCSLTHVDDFNIKIKPPHGGIIPLSIQMEGCDSVSFELRAENDDLLKLKSWMEQVVREEHARIELSCGQSLEYHVTDVPESSVEPTMRFIDELFPSPIGILTLLPAQGGGVEGVIKVKHFLNFLYLHLLTGGNADTLHGHYGQLFQKEWYPYNTNDETRYPFYQRLDRRLWHYNQLQSTLIEWYVCSSVSYAELHPCFQITRAIPEVITMWDDWGELFWHEGCGVGGDRGLGYGKFDYSLSEIKDLWQWDADFETVYRSVEDQEENDTGGDGRFHLTQENKDWHIRGYRLAQKVRQVLPLNAGLIYELTFDLAYGSHEWERDIGHVIFDSKLLDDRD